MTPEPLIAPVTSARPRAETIVLGRSRNLIRRER